MSFTDDHSLALYARQGNRDAYAEIVRRHQQAVFSVAYRVLGNVCDAEDATQETFIRAFRFFDKFDVRRPLAPWLKRIAVNVCLNYIEGMKPDSSIEDEIVLVPDPVPGPEVQSLYRARDERIRAELSKLPPHYRIIIELRHFQELSYEEIAKELRKPLSDVKSDLFRARRLLASRLKDLT